MSPGAPEMTTCLVIGSSVVYPWTFCPSGETSVPAASKVNAPARV